MRKTIRLTESEFRTMVEETITEALQDEGLWNNIKTGAKTFTSNVGAGKGLNNAWSNAKKNYNLQGEYDDMSSLIQQLNKFINAGKIDPQTTIAQLVGGNYNGGKFGKMTGKMHNYMSQMRKNGLKKN